MWVQEKKKKYSVKNYFIAYDIILLIFLLNLNCKKFRGPRRAHTSATLKTGFVNGRVTSIKEGYFKRGVSVPFILNNNFIMHTRSCIYNRLS